MQVTNISSCSTGAILNIIQVYLMIDPFATYIPISFLQYFLMKKMYVWGEKEIKNYACRWAESKGVSHSKRENGLQNPLLQDFKPSYNPYLALSPLSTSLNFSFLHKLKDIFNS